jgi:hypothetical protein
MPAQAGIHGTFAWISACAEMTPAGAPTYAVSSNSSRPISQRRISLVPAPIS